MRWAIAFLLLLGLAACRYESTADLRSSATVYKITGAFPVGQYVFQSRDQSNLLVLDVQTTSARIAYQDQGQSPLSETMIAILGSDHFPKNTYVAVALNRKDKSGAQVYSYYPFWFNEAFLAWQKPASVTQVFGLADLAQHLTAAKLADQALKFHLVTPENRPAVLARFEAWRQSSKSAPANAPVAAPVAPPAVATAPEVKGFSIGDGVYVQGVLSDKPSIIQEIDAANQRVKVRRYDDGVSEWVGYDSIITRDQSTVNDLARGAATIGVFVCMLSPETCQPAQK